MRRLFPPALFAVAAAALSTVPAVAQTKTKPGYIIIRVLLENGGNAGAPGAGGAVPQPKVNPSNSVAVVVPYDFIEKRLLDPNKSPNKVTNPYWPAVKHKYGYCYLYSDTTFIQVFAPKTTDYPVFTRELKLGYEKWSMKRGFDTIHDLCEKALMFGLIDEAGKWCEEYLAVAKIDESKAPTAQYTAFAKAYKGLPEKLTATLPTNEAVEQWKGRVGASGVLQSAHYSLLYFDTNQQSDAQRRLKVLESNFKAFYLWHALHGMPLPMPAKKLIVMVSDSNPRVAEFRKGLDALPVSSDAFYSPSHNILMLAPEPMDPHGNAFMNLTRAKWANGWNRDDLINTKLPPIAPGKAIETTQMQMLAVAERYLTDESDNAAISREGSRQLMAATNMLPPHVRLPEWLENGIGFYFQRAKGTVYYVSANGWRMFVPLATGYGAPNFQLHRGFDTVKHEFARSPENTLKNVLSGNYYLGSTTGQDFDPPPPPPPGSPEGTQSPPPQPAPGESEEQFVARRLQTLRVKANTSCWALIYYLQKTKLAGMQKLYQELSRMPRDMQIEHETVLKAFCRSFGLQRNDGSEDPEAFRTFAVDWLQYMNNVPHFDIEQPLSAAALDPFAAAGGGAPAGGVGAPAGGGPPGGNPPPGGGGTPPGGRPGGRPPGN